MQVWKNVRVRGAFWLAQLLTGYLRLRLSELNWRKGVTRVLSQRFGREQVREMSDGRRNRHSEEKEFWFKEPGEAFKRGQVSIVRGC